MNQEYITVRIPCLDEQKEILCAELDVLGSDGVWDKGIEVEAYFPKEIWDQKVLYDMLSNYGLENSFHISTLEDKNWNQEWESGFDPIRIDDEVLIRATFHEHEPGFKYELVIDPRMSFGTGHHATTRLMIDMMLTMDLQGKKVLDMGSGTGVLSFLAAQMGASEVIGVEVDSNSVDNARDNSKYNLSTGVRFIEGSHEAMPDIEFDIILSNITRNINRSLLPHLIKKLLRDGYLVMAGFLNFDLEEMVQLCADHGARLIRNKSLDDWEVIIVQKK